MCTFLAICAPTIGKMEKIRRKRNHKITQSTNLNSKKEKNSNQNEQPNNERTSKYNQSNFMMTITQIEVNNSATKKENYRFSFKIKLKNYNHEA